MEHIRQMDLGDFNELKEVIKEFLSKYRYLYEMRIQKLVYFAELYSMDNYEKRLTNATWKPYMFGSFSEDVRNALEDLDVDSEVVRRNGSRTRKYFGYNVSAGSLSDGKKAIIQRVHEKTKNKGTEEMGKESKETWLYQEEEFDQPMDFGKYLQHIRSVSKSERRYYDPDAPDIQDIRSLHDVSTNGQDTPRTAS